MKNNIYSLLFIVASFLSSVQAQVAIGVNTAHPSAALDVNVNSLPNNAKKGLLFPRVDLQNATDVTTIPSPANGLLVYNRTDGGTSPNEILANNLYSWRINTWKKFTNIPEVKELKLPTDFVLASVTKQIFTSTEITLLNSPAVVNTVPIVWNTATDVLIANPDDIVLETTSTIRVLTTSLYQISGTFSFKPDTSGNATNCVITLQSSTNNGTSWTNVLGSALPFEIGSAQHVQTIVLPGALKEFQQNELLRFVVSRPKNPYASGASPANYGTNSGIQSRLDTDLNKSVRIRKITE